MLDVVLYRKSSRVVDANVAAEPEEYPASLKRYRVRARNTRAFAQRAEH